jgi:FlaA1/EpsC-like NDP-sugar epimerase
MVDSVILPKFYFDIYMLVLLLVEPGYMILYALFKVYAPKRIQSIRAEFANVLKGNILGILIFLTLLFFTKQVNFSRQMLMLFFIINVFLEMSVRVWIRVALRTMEKKDS